MRGKVEKCAGGLSLSIISSTSRPMIVPPLTAGLAGIRGFASSRAPARFTLRELCAKPCHALLQVDGGSFGLRCGRHVRDGRLGRHHMTMAARSIVPEITNVDASVDVNAPLLENHFIAI